MVASCMDEHRNDPRQRLFKGATIVFGGGDFTYKCVVRNRSSTGASAEMESPDGVPNHFRLVLDDGSLSRMCRVVWRSPTRLGMEFEPDP